MRASDCLRVWLPSFPKRQLSGHRRVSGIASHVLSRVPPLLRQPRGWLRVHNPTALLSPRLRVLSPNPPVRGPRRVSSWTSSLQCQDQRALHQSSRRLQVRETHPGREGYEETGLSGRLQLRRRFEEVLR